MGFFERAHRSPEAESGGPRSPLLTMLLAAAIIYGALTFMIGYQRGRENAALYANLTGNDLGSQDAREFVIAGAKANAPDWERVSPLFDLGVQAGLSSK